MRRKILGINGKIGSGKNAFAELFAKQLPNRVECHSMADKLREVIEVLFEVKMTVTNEKGMPFCNTIYNFTQEQKNIYLPKFKKTIGELMQYIGTDLLRNHLDEDIWVKTLFNDTMKNKIDNGMIIVIPDVRFKNEAKYILDEGGYLIRLNGDPNKIRENSTRDLNHISEIDLDDFNGFDKILDNSKKDFNNLKNIVNEVINDFGF